MSKKDVSGFDLVWFELIRFVQINFIYSTFNWAPPHSLQDGRSAARYCAECVHPRHARGRGRSMEHPSVTPRFHYVRLSRPQSLLRINTVVQSDFKWTSKWSSQSSDLAWPKIQGKISKDDTLRHDSRAPKTAADPRQQGGSRVPRPRARVLQPSASVRWRPHSDPRNQSVVSLSLSLSPPPPPHFMLLHGIGSGIIVLTSQWLTSVNKI